MQTDSISHHKNVKYLKQSNVSFSNKLLIAVIIQQQAQTLSLSWCLLFCIIMSRQSRLSHALLELG